MTSGICLLSCGACEDVGAQLCVASAAEATIKHGERDPVPGYPELRISLRANGLGAAVAPSAETPDRKLQR